MDYKMKRLYILLLLFAGVLNAQVPNTATFTLQDVINEVNPNSSTLQSCFENATGTFDPTYEGSKDRLSNFRNYQSAPSYYSDVFSNVGLGSVVESCNTYSNCQNGNVTQDLYTNTNVLALGYIIHTNSSLTSPFNGDNLWYLRFSNAFSYKIAPSGVITEIVDCSALPSYEAETTAYMTALGIPNDATVYYSGTLQARTGAQHWEYVDTFIKAEKAAGIWGTFPTYLFLGGTASRCAINVVNPAQNVITWYGSGVFNQFGFSGNASNAYGSTNFNIASNFDFSNNSITVVCGSNNTETNVDAVLFSAFNSVNQSALIIPKSTNNRIISRYFSSFNTAVANTDARGVYHIGKTNAVTSKIYKNSVELASWSSGGTLPTTNLLVGVIGLGNDTNTYSLSFTNQTIRALSIKTGLTAAQVTAHTNNLNALYASFGTKTW